MWFVQTASSVFKFNEIWLLRYLETNNNLILSNTTISTRTYKECSTPVQITLISDVQYINTSLINIF